MDVIKILAIIALSLFSAFTYAGCSNNTGNSEPTKFNDISQDRGLNADDISKDVELSYENNDNLDNGNKSFSYRGGVGFPQEIQGEFATYKIFNADDSVEFLTMLVPNVHSPAHNDGLSFVCTKEEIRGDRKLFNLEQMYKDVKVFGGGYVVVTNKETGELINVDGWYAPITTSACSVLEVIKLL